MLDQIIIALCALGTAVLVYGRLRVRRWYPVFRAVLWRVFLFGAFLILSWKIRFGLSYIYFLVDALARTPADPLKNYSATILGLSQVADSHNLSLLILAMLGVGIAVDRQLVPQKTAGAASA